MILAERDGWIRGVAARPFGAPAELASYSGAARRSSSSRTIVLDYRGFESSFINHEKAALEGLFFMTGGGVRPTARTRFPLIELRHWSPEAIRTLSALPPLRYRADKASNNSSLFPIMLQGRPLGKPFG